MAKVKDLVRDEPEKNEAGHKLVKDLISKAASKGNVKSIKVKVKMK